MAKNVTDLADGARRNGNHKPAASGRAQGAQSAKVAGLRFERFFTPPGSHAFDLIEWERRTAGITGEKGQVIFEQKDVEVPRTWSQLAINVVAQKYFRGSNGTPERETSVRQIIDRVVNTLAQWGREGGYFATDEDAENWAEELRFLLVTQQASFNSPVWFNIGVPGRAQQGSACFINSVQDSMESILDLVKTEGMLFKFGSGTGTNLSVLRSSREQLSGGGTASGPVSFMKGYDSFAGSIKSGGTTRRAAKMVILNADHPDILDFIRCKAEEEKKAWALIEAGYNVGFNVPGGAYDSVQFQNANNSVRVSDEFMKAVESDKEWETKAVVGGRTVDTYKARTLWREIADATWICGDPGLQFDTTIQDWNCVSNTGRINATNPCSEFVFLDDTACNLLSLNLMKFQSDDGTFNVDRFKRAVDICFTGQEILVSNASYPTPAIAKNSEALRPLGLGYANLGALLMSMGLAYDSAEGARFAGAVTAIMTGEAFAQSARMAQVKGPFSEFAKNREPMLRVMEKHRQAAHQLSTSPESADVVDAARDTWDDAVKLGRAHGYRNAQATVLAPTGCLVGDSLVLTDRGLVRLQGLGDPDGDKWQVLSAQVSTDQGPKTATKFFVNGAEPVVTVETSRGYRIQGTTTHRIKVVDGAGQWTWRRLSDVRAGDRVPMMLGGMVGDPTEVRLPPLPDAYWTSDHRTFVPRQMTSDLAEFVGYFMGDGSLHARGIRFSVTATDRDVVEHLTGLGESLFGLKAAVTEKKGYTEVAFNSVRLVLWWEACGFAKRAPSAEHQGKGYKAHVPDAVLHTNDPAVYGSFVRGLFEADGTVSSGYVSFTTVTEQFSRDVQAILLALGFVTTRKVDQPTIGSWGGSQKYVLRLLNQSVSGLFGQTVGFVSNRKQALVAPADHPQAARYDNIPLSQEMVDQLAPENDRLRQVLMMSIRRHGAVSRRSATALLERTGSVELKQMLSFFYDSVEKAELGDEQLTYDISVPENVTYVANGFVSHNTIGLMMDCDTTGIEPDLALVKYKKLVGGGLLKIVNGTVPAALRKLGYDEHQVKEIVIFIDENDTIEGAPHLAEEHLKVFDCAFKPVNGTRSIAPMGHVRMMAGVQPFISGSMSKTVNLPTDATVEDIEQTYFESWKLGLKCIAIYRDGCKRSQPLSTSRDKEKAAPAEVEYRAMRRKLPDERKAVTHKFDIQGHEGYLTVGLFEDGTPGELFVTMAKEGSTISGLMDAFATQTSYALQFGVPVKFMVDKFSHMRFEPSGFTKNKEIPIAKSIVDYIFRWMASHFLGVEEQDAVGIIRRDAPAESAPAAPSASTPAPAAQPQGSSSEIKVIAAPTTNGGNPVQKFAFVNTDAPACPDCGAITVRSGACYKCLNCGATTGCS
ncbi:MAG: adenosylcobalamin-dependent ribonucleoside-diphosphate reductase [Chloroflexi bacterium]|nr:MAG: adenosylcobalamin-dependent ribonucleoside-diphosphate reductase [Chloroflexota bacterium]